MSSNFRDALELCRSLLAFTSPGNSVTVPHSALAQVVEMASGGAENLDSACGSEPLEQLYDVAALARRYNRALPTVRQWFHDGLFGPPAERRFRGRGYVASAAAVREFEIRTGLKAAVAAADQEMVPSLVGEKPAMPLASKAARNPRAAARTGGIGGKIFAEARGGARRIA